MQAEGDEDEDTLSHERIPFSKRKRKPDVRVRWSKQQRDAQEAEAMDNADPIEFRMLAQDSFMK